MSNEIIDVILENADDDYISDSDAETFERLFQYSVIASFAIGGLILAFWLYPSVMLIIEIRSGIMTRETYPREEFSCCCTSKS